MPALRAVMAHLLGDGDWLRVLSPLIELEADDAAALVAELERHRAFRAVREAYAFAWHSRPQLTLREFY